MDNEETLSTDITIFENQKIRKQWYQDRWFFSIIDVITALTRSKNPRRYWSDLKRKLIADGYVQLYEKIVQLKMPSEDSKMYLTDTADTEALLRIIQSIPSPKAEPFRLWLAQIGTERIQEMRDPAITIERIRDDYRRPGRSEDWIEKRIRSILVRNELTQEWDERGAHKKDYGVLTNIIAKETFGIGPQEHKELKKLQKENLRDHMTPVELVLTMLGEVTTTELHRERDSQGTPTLRHDAKDGGAVAGRAREDIEQQLGTNVVSPNNYLLPSNDLRPIQAPLMEEEAETEESQE